MPNRKPNQTMEKPTVKNVQSQVRFLRLALIASVGFPLLFVGNAFAQLAAPAAPAAAEATAERVIVTGSNIPTAEETGPNPVDTYRVEDIAKLGVRNSTDLQTIIPQEAGGTLNTNIGNGGDGTVQLNLRGLLPISGSVLTVSLAGTATFPLMAFKYPLADSITAAATSRAALEVLQAFGYYRLCSSARTRRHRIRLQTKQLRHFTSGLLTSQPAAVFTLTPLLVKAFFPALMVAAITMGLTSPLLRQHFRRGTGKPTTPL